MLKVTGKLWPIGRLTKLAVWAVALASTAPATTRADERRQAADGDVDVKASRVYVYVGKVGLGHEHAIVGQLKLGKVQLGAANRAGEIVFDMPTFSADTDDARQFIGLEGTTAAGRRKEVTDNMLGADVLNVRKFPTATFEIASALPLKKRSNEGHAMYRLDGDFTLHGVKRPIKVDAELLDAEQGFRLRGAFAIKQTDFGIKPFSKAFGAVGVTDELTIHGDLLIAAQRTAQKSGKKRK
ncbi:MAG TPA: YceI family protein [Pirellulales bacterium]|nr:YceI family protein [Pirellulales bacterium]